MHKKKKGSLFVKFLALFFLLMLAGCQPLETLPEPELPDVENDARENGAVFLKDEEVTDEEIKNGNTAENEEISLNTLLTLSFSAGDFIISADSSLLYFTIPSAPGTLYHVIDLTATEIDSQTISNIEWEAIEALPTPSIIGNTYHLKITADDSNLLYATSEILWDETEYGEKTVIYFSHPDFPPDIYHQIELTGDEVPYAARGSGIRPTWETGKNNIYYLTLSGIYQYSTDDRKQTLIRPAADLPGLVWEEHLAPHAFYLESDKKELAYYNDGTIYFVPLVDRAGKSEKIKIYPGSNDIIGLEYLFNGSYLVLEDSYTSWGYYLDDLSLTFIDRQSGEVILEGNKYLPAGYTLNDHGQMFFKSRGPNDEGFFVLLDNSLTERSRISAKGIIPTEKFFPYVDVIRLDGRWALPVNMGMETHFIEIYFD